MRAALLVSTLIACAACNDRASIECGVYQFTTVDPSAQDCGSFTRGNQNYTDEAMIAAQLCVLNAIAHQQAFRLAYDANDAAGQAQSGVRAGFRGSLSESTLRLQAYAGRHPNDMSSRDDLVSVRSCNTLIATPSCKPQVGISCLECDGTDPGQIACRG